MKSFVQVSTLLTFTAKENVAAGSVYVVGDLAGIATGDAKPGEDVVVSYSGVFKVPKLTGAGSAIGIGSRVYVTKEGLVTATAEKNVFLGFAIAPAADADTTTIVSVR
jgi:predicted RecA/RadA family phage recombinase